MGDISRNTLEDFCAMVDLYREHNSTQKSIMSTLKTFVTLHCVADGGYILKKSAIKEKIRAKKDIQEKTRRTYCSRLDKLYEFGQKNNLITHNHSGKKKPKPPENGYKPKPPSNHIELRQSIIRKIFKPSTYVLSFEFKDYGSYWVCQGIENNYLITQGKTIRDTIKNLSSLLSETI